MLQSSATTRSILGDLCRWQKKSKNFVEQNPTKQEMYNTLTRNLAISTGLAFTNTSEFTESLINGTADTILDGSQNTLDNAVSKFQDIIVKLKYQTLNDVSNVLLGIPHVTDEDLKNAQYKLSTDGLIKTITAASKIELELLSLVLDNSYEINMTELGAVTTV